VASNPRCSMCWPRGSEKMHSQENIRSQSSAVPGPAPRTPHKVTNQEATDAVGHFVLSFVHSNLRLAPIYEEFDAVHEAGFVRGEE
jgi:hypothetical protein